MTKNFVENCKCLAESTIALCEQAETIQALREKYKSGATATLYLKINDETVSFHDYQSDTHGETIHALLNTKEKALLRALRENADSFTTFVEEEESR